MEDPTESQPIDLPESDDELLDACEIQRFRASGPGGQNVNRRETAIRLRHLPTGIVVHSQDERSQRLNLRIAVRRLRDALEREARPEMPRVPTPVPRRERAKRLAAKRRRALRKRLRRRPDPNEP
jgi:protein subunit release factor B